MKKKIYDLLLLKKRLKKNNSINQISVLNKERQKNDEAVKTLSKLLNSSSLSFHS